MLKTASGLGDANKTMQRTMSIRARFGTPSEAEIWAEMCQADWCLTAARPPSVIELRGPIVVLYWDAQAAGREDLEPEALLREVSAAMDLPVHGLVAAWESCFEFYRASGLSLRLLEQPEEGDLGRASRYLGAEEELDKLDEQSAQSAILDAVAAADQANAY